MKRMRRLSAFALVLMVLWSAVPALAATTEDVDRQILSYAGNGIRWHRTAYGSGSAKDITEKARLDGHDYELRIMSDGRGVAEISLSGWYPDLKMKSDATFRDGLMALTACVYAADDLVPTRNVSYIISPYDVYDVLQAGRFYDTYGFDGWTVEQIRKGRIEASHYCGAYVILSVNGSRFSFTYTSQ